MKSEISIEIDPSIRWNVDIFKTVNESLPYYCRAYIAAEFSDNGLVLTHGGDADSEIISETVRNLMVKVSASFRDAEERIYSSYEGLPIRQGIDPYEWFVERGMIVATGNGKFCYSGDFLRVFQAVDRLIANFSYSLGAKEELYPTTVETKTLLDAGYLKSFPHHAYFAAPVNLDINSLSVISAEKSLKEENRQDTVEQLAFPSQVLAPTVCYHCFEAKRNTKPGRTIVTAVNKCHRHEPVNVRSLERLTTYWMREVIVFDEPVFVQKRLEEILSWTTELLKELGVTHKVVSANDPFFADSSMSKRLFQNAYELKKEIKVPIHSGKWISIGSFNNHQRSILDKFNIQDDNAEAFSSGCVGWGLERLLYGIFSHLGPDLKRWPDSAKKLLNI